MSKTRQWDTERARTLLEEGHSPLDVADMVGASVNAVKAWMRLEKIGGGTTVQTKLPPEPVMSSAQDEESVSDPYVYKGDMSAEEFQAMQDAAGEEPEDTEMPSGEEGAQACMYAASLGELLMTAAQEFAKPVVLLSDGTPVRGCRVEITYGITGNTERVEIYLN